MDSRSNSSIGMNSAHRMLVRHDRVETTGQWSGWTAFVKEVLVGSDAIEIHFGKPFKARNSRSGLDKIRDGRATRFEDDDLLRLGAAKRRLDRLNAGRDRTELLVQSLLLLPWGRAMKPYGTAAQVGAGRGRRLRKNKEWQLLWHAWPPGYWLSDFPGRVASFH